MMPAQSYIICATPRSGSTLLCSLLTNTGIAGRPNSFFQRKSYLEWAEYLDVDTSTWSDEGAFNQAYLDAALKEGFNATPIFGLRLMWESLGDLSIRLDHFYPGSESDSDRFQAAFGLPVYIYLSREDLVAQAVSLLKAEQSGLWHIAPDGSELERLKTGQIPVYDQQAIQSSVNEALQHNQAWESWFASQNIQPLRLTYETLSKNPKACLSKVLTALNLDTAIADEVEPGTAKLADAISREWIARFKASEMEK